MNREDRIICRCEEILESEIRCAVEEGCHTVKSVKMRTRAGMGNCQGSTCALLIRRIINEMTGIPMEEIEETTSRFPAYIVRLDTLADGAAAGKETEISGKTGNINIGGE